MLHAFDGAIIEVEVRDLEPRGARNSRGIAPYRESMVLRGDKYLSGRKIAHGMVAAAMAVRELHGFAPKGEAEELVAEADAEDRHAAVGQVAQRRDRVAHGRRIAGAVREEHAVRRQLPHPRGRCGGGATRPGCRWHASSTAWPRARAPPRQRRAAGRTPRPRD